MDMNLRDVAECLQIPFRNTISLTVQGAAIDSRIIKKGMLFFALSGTRTDGHLFLDEVRKRGACAAVVNTDRIPAGILKQDNFFFPVKDTAQALQAVAGVYRNKFQIPVIAVTGTNGKTTVKEMVAAVLGSQYKVCKSEGNFNNHIGVPLSICNWNSDCEVAILEMGTNHFGEIDKLCEIARPTHGIITNIGKGHLAYFQDTRGVARAKKELLDFLKENGKAFLNGDDSTLRSFQSIVNPTIMYGFQESNTFRALDPDIDENGFPTMRLNGRKIKLAVLGKHNLMNALAAAAVGRTFDISWENVMKQLIHFNPCDKRMEQIDISGITILNDTYNANPGSVVEALHTLLSLKKKKRRIVVLGDMLELGSVSNQEHQNIGKTIAELRIDAFFAYGPEMKNAILAAEQSGLAAVKHFTNQSALVDALFSFIQIEDAVLIKGSRGMQMEDVVAGLKKKIAKK